MNGASLLPLRTERLVLDELGDADAPFLLELLNEPAFIANIADRGVRSVDDAIAYLRAGPQASYERHGHGLWRVALADSDEPIGICGLLRRDSLPDPDIGYALLSRFAGRGYALEAAAATLRVAREHFGIDRLLAITHPDNAGSIRLLRKLGFADASDPELVTAAAPSRLFVNDRLACVD